MGNFDYKNICLQIKTREDFTDPRIAEFIKDWSFTEKECDAFLDTVRNNISNEYSIRIVDFFINYKNGILLPDKCDAYETININVSFMAAYSLRPLPHTPMSRYIGIKATS